jgi:lipid-A-disaccharide synthase
MGGDLMRESGVKILRDFTDLTTFGFYEGLKNYFRLKKIYNEFSNYLYLLRPDIFLPISFAGFNLRLSAVAKKLGVRVIYFAPPQLWAWGRWRAKVLRRNTDKVICLFPFEEQFFQNLGVKAIYLGNPLLDYVEQGKNLPSNILNSVPPGSKIITFMPGSRKDEIRNHLPLMLHIFQKLKKEIANLIGFVITENSNHLPTIDQLYYTKEARYQIMAKSDLIVTSSGTAALEAGILGVFHIGIYRLSLPSYFLARVLVKTKRFLLTNIILKEDIVPEIIQPTFPKLYPIVIKLLQNPQSFRKERLLRIKNILGPSGAAKRIAQAIVA